MVIIKLFANTHRFLSVLHCLQKLLQVKHPLTNVIIALKKVTVKSLQNKLGLLPRSIDIEDLPIIERSLTIHQSVVSVSALLLILVKI